MALTQGSWSEATVNGFKVLTNTVTATTAENDAYTLKTPKSLDTSKPWYLALTFSGTPDGSALPVEIWTGFSDDFVISGDAGSITATDGGKFKQIFDDCVLAVSGLNYFWLMDPELAVADVVTVAAVATGLKVRIPYAPYYAFNLNGASTLAAVTGTWKIIQAADGSNSPFGTVGGIGSDPS